MNEAINELISIHEQEYIELESLVNNAVLEGDYKSAHLFQKGLREISIKLQILRSLKDPYYRKKNDLENRINRYKKIHETENGHLISEYLEQEIEKLNQKINILNSFENPPFIDGQELDDLIFDLVDGRIKCFIFHLKRSQKLFLKFKRKKDFLVISLPPLSKIGDEIYFPKSTIKILKTIGFSKNKGQKKYSFRYTLTEFRDAISIKMLVSRVVYEVFHPYVLDNPASLEIIE